MRTYVALLRGINVSGRNIVPMSGLKKLFLGSGFLDVVTYLNSGNVVFRTRNAAPDRLRSVIESAVKRQFALEIKVLVSTLEQLIRCLRACPYDPGKLRPGENIFLTILSSVPVAELVDNLTSAKDETDECLTTGNVVYILTRRGYSKTSYANSFIEKTLAVDATTRNINSLNKIAEIGSKLGR